MLEQRRKFGLFTCLNQVETVRHIGNAALIFTKIGSTKRLKLSLSQMLLYAMT